MARKRAASRKPKSHRPSPSAGPKLSQAAKVAATAAAAGKPGKAARTPGPAGAKFSRPGRPVDSSHAADSATAAAAGRSKTPGAPAATAAAGPWPVPMFAIVALCVAAAVPGTFVTSNIGFSDHYREAIAAVGFLGLLAFWLWRNRELRAVELTFSWTRLWLGALLALGGASVLWAVDLGFFFSKYLLWLAAAAAVLVTLNARVDLNAFLQLARGLSIAAAYIATVGLVQVLFETDIFLQTASPSANYHNKNAAMQVIVLAFPMLVFGALFERHRRIALLYWAALALVLAFAFHTQTRSAWLALLLELLVLACAFVYLRRSWRRFPDDGAGVINWRRMHQLAAAAALLLLVALINASPQGLGGAGRALTQAVTSIQQDFSSYTQARPSERYRIWSDTLTMLERRPALGSGMGSFSHNLLTGTKQYQTFAPLRVHNDVLETGVELGAAGVALVVAAALGLLACLWRAAQLGNLQTRAFYLALAAALFGSALNMQFSFPYQMPVPLILFGVYAGLILKAAGGRVKSFAVRPRHWRLSCAAAGLAGALALALNLTWLNTVFDAEANTRAGVWRDPIPRLAPLPPLCHRGIVQLFVRLGSAFQSFERYPESLGVADSIEHCVPDSWVTRQIEIVGLYKEERWEETIAALNRARDHAPLGNYRDYVNLLATYTETGRHADALQVFRELTAEPQELLVKRPKTLRSIVLFALQVHEPDTAQKFYRLLRAHYGRNRKFDDKMLPVAQRMPAAMAEEFIAWKTALDAELSGK